MDSIYKQTGIYRITNRRNGKSYIGKTSMNFGDRWDSHRSLLRSGRHSNPYLQNDWNEFGERAFEFMVICHADSEEELNFLERKYIKEYRESGHCYNIHDGGDVGINLGKHLSDDTKRKIGEKNKQNMLGRKVSPEVRAKMSASQKARYSSWTDEDRKRHGKTSSICASGYTWDDEAKKKFSKLQRSHPNRSKYTPDDIRAIREKRTAGASMESLAKEYGTSAAYIASIVYRKRWANI